MLHEHVPIRKDEEMCCADCGQVLGSSPIEYENSPDLNVGGEYAYPGLSKLMVGLGLERSMNWKHQDNRQIRDYQNLLNNLKNLCVKEGLPQHVAYETMRRLLSKKRGLYSFRLQIRELLSVMNDDYRLVFKVRVIKQKYENITGI